MVILFHGDRSVIECGQQVPSDVSDLTAGCFHAVEDVFHMETVQHLKPLLNNVKREISTSNADCGLGAAQHIGHQFHDDRNLVLTVHGKKLL